MKEIWMDGGLLDHEHGILFAYGFAVDRVLRDGNEITKENIAKALSKSLETFFQNGAKETDLSVQVMRKAIAQILNPVQTSSRKIE